MDAVQFLGSEANIRMKIPHWFFIIILSLLFVPFVELCGQKSFIQEGKASFYADKFEGKKTASGEIYRHSKPTAAHKTLPFGTRVKVTNKANQKSTIVRINDRGPFVKGRIIDLSKSAAKKLGYLKEGVTDVKIEVVKEAGNATKNQAGIIGTLYVSKNRKYSKSNIYIFSYF